jgi:hypothetical protein
MQENKRTDNDSTRKKLCMCIPTYKRSEQIKVKLDTEAGMFYRHGVDIIVYDSSPDDETENTIKGYTDAGYTNIRYRRVPENFTSNEKIYLIWQGAAESSYDYIWVMHDHTMCTEEERLVFLLDALEKDYGFYLLNFQATEDNLEEICGNDDFLIRGAWRLNSYGCSVLSVKRFIVGTDWDYFKGKYDIPQMRNYSQIGYYYERASQIDKFSAAELKFKRSGFIDFLRYNEVPWEWEVLHISAEAWCNVIWALPDVYKKKNKAIRTQDKWFLTEFKLLMYRKKDRYNISEYKKYRRYLRVLHPHTFIHDLLIAYLPYDKAERLFLGGLIRSVKRAQKKKESVYIFGAGRHGFECADLMDELGLEFDAFLVTDMAGNPEELHGHPVFAAKERLKDESALIVLAVLSSGVKEVKKYLNTLKAGNRDIRYTGIE